jgi:UDP-N-acetylglucosamine transferase subunit ALG13
VDDKEIVVQHGPSPIRPPAARCVDFMAYDELAVLVRRARAFVTHAGVGSIMLSLAAHRRPIVVPRLRRFGEAVDDHQVVLATRLGSEGLVTPVSSPSGLQEALARTDHDILRPHGSTTLQRDVYEYVRAFASPSADGMSGKR